MNFTKRIMGFIDGENLVMRYQAMLNQGYVPRDAIQHVEDTFVWHPSALKITSVDIIRISYYTYVVGDDNRVDEINRNICKLNWDKGPYGATSPLSGTLFPRIFKKSKKTAKRKGVDISITVDALSHVYNGSVDTVYLITGDGDYLPLIEQVINAGKQIYLAALSEGLNDKLKYSVDKFINLDSVFFKSEDEMTPKQRRIISKGISL